ALEPPAGMLRLRPTEDTVPELTLTPPKGGAPTATTRSPARASEEAKLSAASPEAPTAWSTAMPWATSAPATTAPYTCPSGSATRSWVAPSRAWALVTTSPSELATKPTAKPLGWPSRSPGASGWVSTLAMLGAAVVAIAPTLAGCAWLPGCDAGAWVMTLSTGP